MGEDREPTRKREASDDSDSEIPDSLDFSGNAHDFNIPPDDEMIPKRIDIGSWVFALFKETGRTAVRGIVVSRTKRRGQLTVRFEENNGPPGDYEMYNYQLSKTRAEAEETKKRHIDDVSDQGDTASVFDFCPGLISSSESSDGSSDNTPSSANDDGDDDDIETSRGETIAITEYEAEIDAIDHEIRATAPSTSDGSTIELELIGISITQADLDRLDPVNEDSDSTEQRRWWLNDSVVDAGMLMIDQLQQRWDDNNIPISEQRHTNSIVLSALFIPLLTAPGRPTALPAAMIARLKAVKPDQVAVPVCHGGHWTFVVIIRKPPGIDVCDSLHHRLPAHIITALRTWADDTLNIIIIGAPTYRNVPTQRNSADCGIYMLMYARHVFSRRDFNMTPGDAIDFRALLRAWLLHRQQQQQRQRQQQSSRLLRRLQPHNNDGDNEVLGPRRSRNSMQKRNALVSGPNMGDTTSEDTNESGMSAAALDDNDSIEDGDDMMRIVVPGLKRGTNGCGVAVAGMYDAALDANERIGSGDDMMRIGADEAPL